MLVNCVAYQDGRKLADIPIAEISDYLKKPQCFVWVALKDATPGELEEMRAEFGLHELAVEDARHGHQRPKIEEYGESVFAVLKTVEPAGEELSIGEIHLFVGRNYVLSIRNRSERQLTDVRERCERSPELLKQGAGFVFYAVMDAVVDRYFPIIEDFETRLEGIEERIFAKATMRANIESLYALKRQVLVLKHAVAPLLEAVNKLHGGRVPPACANSQEYFRDVFDHLARLNISIDDIRDMIATAMQVNLAMATIEESEVMKRLAAWAGIFAAATALAGIWGMNFEHMPELKWHYGYLAALLLIAGVAGGLYYRFKRSGWL